MKGQWLLIILILILSSSVQAADRELRIAMVLWRGETEAEIGFKEGLEELGYNPSYEIHDAAQNISQLGGILRTINDNLVRYDYIYTFGTTVSRRAKVVIGTKLPQIFNIVTDPVGAGIADSLDSPGPTVGGGSDKIGISQQLEEVGKLVTFKKLGLFFNPREKNSLLIRDELHRYGKEHGFEVIDFRSPPVDQLLAKNLEKLIDNPALVDAVYLAPDSYLVSEGMLIGAQLRKAKLISITQIHSLIEHGVLIGVAGDYRELGRSVAAIIDRHQNGMTFDQIPVAHFESLKLHINRETAELLGVQLDRTLFPNAILVE